MTLREWTMAEVVAIPLPSTRLSDNARMKSKPRALREACGLTLRQVAADLEYDKGAFSRLETGQRAWSIKFGIQWLDYFSLVVAKARKDGLPIPDEAIPTLRELATLGPDDARTRRSRAVKSKRARK